MIVVKDAFVYIHHPKTGGTFVTKMLHKIASNNDDFIVEELQGLKHAGINKIPKAYQDLPVVINIRNVFEHYVSRYKFRWWADPEHSDKMFKRGKVKGIYADFPDLTFSQFLRLFNEWALRRMPENRVKKLTNLNIGVNSWVLLRLTSKKPLEFVEEFDKLNNETLMKKFEHIHFLKTERLNDDLYSFLKKCGVKDSKISFIQNTPPILPKKGGRGKLEFTWMNYFSKEDIKFVMEKDRLYFRMFPDTMPNIELKRDNLN